MVQIPKFTYSIFVLKFSLVIQFYNQKKMIFFLVRFKLYAMIDTGTCTENLKKRKYKNLGTGLSGPF